MKLLFTILLFISTLATAGPARLPAQTNAAAAVPAAPAGPSPWTMTTRGLLWNENLQIQENSIKTEYKGQFTAVAIGASHQKPLTNRRWIQTNNFEFIVGAAHVTGQSNGFSDYIKNQMCIGLLLSTGIVYRTTKVSEIGFNIPLFFRTAQWKVNRSTLNLYNQEITSFGFEMTSALRFSTNKSFIMGYTYIQSLPTAIWKVGVDTKF